MQTTIVTRRPRARMFDRRNTAVTVSVGDTVKTAWGRGSVKRISPAGLHVRINDPGKFEHGRIVVVQSIR